VSDDILLNYVYVQGCEGFGEIDRCQHHYSAVICSPRPANRPARPARGVAQCCPACQLGVGDIPGIPISLRHICATALPGQAISGVATTKASSLRTRRGSDTRVRYVRCGLHYATSLALPGVLSPHRRAPGKRIVPEKALSRLRPEVWHEVRRRAQQESLRQLATAYGVSHETIRRIMRTAIASEAPVPSRDSCAEPLSSRRTG
jgi:hypothetical protein